MVTTRKKKKNISPVQRDRSRYKLRRFLLRNVCFMKWSGNVGWRSNKLSKIMIINRIMRAFSNTNLNIFQRFIFLTVTVNFKFNQNYFFHRRMPILASISTRENANYRHILRDDRSIWESTLKVLKVPILWREFSSLWRPVFKQFQIHLAFRYKNKNSFIEKHVDSQILTIIHSNIVNVQQQARAANFKKGLHQCYFTIGDQY